jgi:transmembrane sensor
MDDRSSPSPDRRLAEHIGRVRDEGGAIEELADRDDDLVRTLLAYRRERRREVPSVSSDTSQRLWTRIEAEMDDASRAGDRRPDRGPVRSAARSVGRRTAIGIGGLLLVGVVAWLLLDASGPALVAEAETSIATYETARGDRVRLRPHSRLYRQAGTARYRLEGEALFDVVPGRDAPFTVEADGAEVRVLGTRFTVQTWTPTPVVFLAEGRVTLRSVAAGTTAVLRPGQRGSVAADGGLSVQSADSSAYVDWLKGRLSFDAQPARAVAAELEQHYGVRLALPDSLAAQPITGRLLLDRRPRTLEDFGRVLGGRFVRQPDRTFVFRAD